MSLEDISSEFLSDESECEAETENLRDGEDGNDEGASYLELGDLLDMLKSFDHIYINNALIDEEFMASDAAELSESDSTDSDLAYILSSIDVSIYEDTLSTNSSPSSSDASHEGLPSSGSEDSARTRLREFVQWIEDTMSTSSSSLSTVSEGADEQPANGDDASDSQEEVAESTLLTSDANQ